MGVEQEIEAIRTGIRVGRFSNEASVSQGIVLRLLAALGWECFNPDVVWPEYSLSGRRVDFALCSPPGKPIAFIEVKQIGQSEGAERQLFEYAFHDGVPLAILTDGREWNFFLPGEQGSYGERRVYKLDLVERDVEECSERLERYLLHAAVASGAAIQAARDDYRNVSKDRQMQAALPKAWRLIIEDEDEMLLEIVADRVESLCGFKPEPDTVAKFLKGISSAQAAPQAATTRTAATSTRPLASLASTTALTSAPQPAPAARPSQAMSGQIGFAFEGRFHSARTAIDTLRQVFDLLIARDPTFGERFAGLPRHGRTRRYLAREVNELYQNRPDLGSVRLQSGWWMSTNHSKQTIGQIIAMACDVAQVAYGKDLVANLGD
ncbi:MAG: type I restriction endonuclease [Acidithiobacillus sp.]